MRSAAARSPTSAASARARLSNPPRPMPAEKRREEWVDAARCVAMLSILSLHAGADAAVLSTPVGGALCLFFALAGYFMPREAGRAARRALRLGLAWLLWSLISLGLYVAVQPGVEWSWARAFGLCGEPAYNTPLWFLKDLCLFQLVVAGLAALRLLPRHGWLLLALLAACTYAAEPAQHEAVRFSWLPALLLGYNLRAIPLPQLRAWLQQHAWHLLLGGAALLLQRTYYPELLQATGRQAAACSLPVGALVWAVWYLLAAEWLARHCRRLAAGMAQAGACMLFIYAAHSLAYAPFYHMGIAPAWGVCAMLGLLAGLTVLGRGLQRICPRAMGLLTAR